MIKTVAQKSLIAVAEMVIEPRRELVFADWKRKQTAVGYGLIDYEWV